jgi:ribonuclease R
VPGLAMSGLVHLSSVEDDFFVFDTERGQLTGRRTRRVIRLGDKVQVQVDKVDSFKKQVDFRLVRDVRSEPARSARDGRSETPRPARGRESQPKPQWNRPAGGEQKFRRSRRRR